MQIQAPLLATAPEHPANRVAGPAVSLSEGLARELGLLDGQVVRGAVNAAGDELELQLPRLQDWRYQRLPVNGSGYKAASFWFRVEFSPYGVWLRPVKPAGAHPAVPNAASGDDIETLPLQGTGIDRADYLARLGDVLSRRGLYDFARMQQLARLVPLPEARQLLQSLQLSVTALTARDIHSALRHCGLFSAAGNEALPDLRRLLQLLQKHTASRTDPGHDQDEDVLQAVAQQLDSARMEAVAARSQGEIHYRFHLLFGEQTPVEVRLRRRAAGPADDEESYGVELNLSVDGARSFSLSCLLRAQRHLTLVAWVPDIELAGTLQRQVPVLRQRLLEQGIQLDACNVFDRERPEQIDAGAAGPGSTLELKV